MKHVLFFLVLAGLIISSSAFAALPPHMEGACMFTFKSSVPAAKSKEAAMAYMKSIKDKGYDCVILKSHDGKNWGTIMHGTFEPAFSDHLVDAGHKLNMRVYSYFTARLDFENVIAKSVELAERTLKMGADGVVIDDLDLFGKSPEKWRSVFKQLRHMTDRYKGKILASSTHPHLSSSGRFPTLWGIAFEYSDYFLPQEYWMEFKAYNEKGERAQMTPTDALAYGQAQFDIVKTRYKKAKNCKLVPIGRTYGKNVTATQVKAFLENTARHYKGGGLFVIEQEPKEGGWNAIKAAAKAFTPGRAVDDLSCFNRVNAPCHDVPDMANAKGKKPASPKKSERSKKKEAKNKKTQLHQLDHTSRCGACP